MTDKMTLTDEVAMVDMDAASDVATTGRRALVQPSNIRLEACTHCQLKCPVCQTAMGEIHKHIGAGFVRFNNFKTLIDENPWVEEIELSNNGEIFLNPHMSKIMRYAFGRDVRLTASNGVNFNDIRAEVLEDLVRYQFRHLRVSLDGATAQTYEKYRVAGDFDTVIRNIETLNRHKQTHGSKYPELTWQFIVFGHNEHEIEDARAMAVALDMDFFLKLNWDESYSPVKDAKAVRKKQKDSVASRSEFQEKFGHHYMQRLCHQLWDQPQVNWNGDIFGCCRNTWKAFDVNAFDDGLEAALNAEQINYARAMVTGQAEARDDVPCTKCRIYKIMEKNGRYIARD